MGDCGSWSANIKLSQKIDISQTEENSSETITEFVKNNPSISFRQKTLKEIKDDDILISVDVFDEDDGEIATVELKDLELENVNAKEFIDKKLYDEYDEFEPDDMCIENCIFMVEIQNVESLLKFLNLTLLKKYIYAWMVNSPAEINDMSTLANCRNYIYCHSNNTDSSSFTITQDFINSLKPGDTLIVEGDGNGNC